MIVFSQLKKDPVLDKVGITRVEIDSGLIDNPYEVSELGNCLVIFDDIDMIRDVKLRNAVRRLCDQVGAGRPHCASIVLWGSREGSTPSLTCVCLFDMRSCWRSGARRTRG